VPALSASAATSRASAAKSSTLSIIVRRLLRDKAGDPREQRSFSHDRLADQRRPGDPRRQAGRQHRPDPGHVARRGDHPGAHRRRKAVGRHRLDPSQCQDRRPSSWSARERPLCRARPRADALDSPSPWACVMPTWPTRSANRRPPAIPPAARASPRRPTAWRKPRAPEARRLAIPQEWRIIAFDIAGYSAAAQPCQIRRRDKKIAGRKQMGGWLAS